MNDEWVNERTNERTNELMHGGWINGWMDHEWMNEWMNEWSIGQMNQKIEIFSFVALPSPNTKKNHPKWDLGLGFLHLAAFVPFSVPVRPFCFRFEVAGGKRLGNNLRWEWKATSGNRQRQAFRKLCFLDLLVNVASSLTKNFPKSTDLLLCLSSFVCKHCQLFNSNLAFITFGNLFVVA